MCDKISLCSGDDRLLQWASESELEISVGKIYVVLAITNFFDSFFYYLMSDEEFDFPLAFPAALFEVVDYRVPKCWSVELASTEALLSIEIGNHDIVSFKEWVLEKDFFYEKLLEGSKREVQIFSFYKQQMLDESANSLPSK